MATKTLADWLDSSSSDSDSPKPLRRKSSGAFAVFDSSKGYKGGANTIRTRSPNVPSISSDSPRRGGARRASSRNSIRRSSSRASSVMAPIRGVGGTTPPPDPPLPKIDAAKTKRQQEAEERKKRMEEMKARLRETLGETVADKIAGPDNKATNPADGKSHKEKEKDKSKLDQSDDYGSDFHSIAGDKVGAPMPSHLPPLSARSSGDFGKKGLAAHFHHASPPRHVVVESEVMLADRGTQTACEVEVQTDPDPLVTSCPQCYKETYGHMHHNFFNCGHAGSPAVVAAASQSRLMGGDPVFSKLLAARMGGAGGYYGVGASSYGLGGLGFGVLPKADDLAFASPTVGGLMPSTGDQWRDQLNFIENSIDMLIKRYNLPPPPGMEQLAPAGMKY